MRLIFLAGAFCVLPIALKAAEITAPVNATSSTGIGEQIGTIDLRDSADGLQIRTNLAKLPPGSHGFHVHENPNCAPGMADGKPVAGLAAGGHFDPGHTGKHLGPNGPGHLGDLVALTVGPDGQARTNITVRRLTVAAIRGRALMIHAGGDTYGEPPTLGGGGARIACAVIK
jgi:Cu-Zn family superoxide dismutase